MEFILAIVISFLAMMFFGKDSLKAFSVAGIVYIIIYVFLLYNSEYREYYPAYMHWYDTLPPSFTLVEACSGFLIPFFLVKFFYKKLIGL